MRYLAEPIRDRDGTVIASIGISAPVARLPKEREKEYSGQVTAAAAQIGDMIGTLED